VSNNFFDFQDQLKRPKKGAPKKAESAPQGDVPLTVSELTFQIDQAIKIGVPEKVLVQGEVSNYKHHGASGHVYFTLKDSDACIDCVIWKSDAARLKFKPEDGMELVATGRVSVYAAKGKYQLYVTSLQPLGVGALELAFKQLYEKLAKEGLFAPERKRPIPMYPCNVALVTSSATAALQDMLKVLRRFSWLRLFLYHVPVQGDGSAEKMAEALDGISRRADGMGIEVILLARGGGSLEDLWEFNEEILARAICKCRIPVVTGIGHEIDVSIADLVADHHAHTPTEAAQVVTGQWRSAVDLLDASNARLRRSLRNLVQSVRQRLLAIERHEAFRRPTDRINNLRQLLDEREKVLGMAIAARVASPKQRLTNSKARLERGIGNYLLRQKQKVAALETHLNAVGPEQVLKRGYTITTVKRGDGPLKSASQIKGGETLVTRFVDGEVESVAEDPKQPKLFQ